MASSELEKAKTLLTLALFRQDPKACQPKEIETIASLLQTATNKCSAQNVQNCKNWALTHLVPSERRVEPFCNYLVALSNSYSSNNTTPSKLATSGETPVASAARRRLHLLYIINDILYHVKFRLEAGQQAFVAKLEPTLPLLVKSAASFIRRPKQIEKIKGLISIWSERGYFSVAFLDSLKKAVDEGMTKGTSGQNDTTAQDNATSAASGPKPVPFNIPKRHGDLSMAWYDLPPGNWLRWIDDTYPLDPQKITPMEFKPGRAREELIQDVTSALADMKRIFAKESRLDGPQFDISEMGERLERSNTGEITSGDTYFGWSRRFCRKTKDEKRDRISRGRAPERSQSFSHSASRSTSQAHGQYQRRNESDASSGRMGFRQHRSHSVASSRSDRSDRRRSRSHGFSRSSSRGSDHRARDYHTSENRPRGGFVSGYNSHRGGHRQESGGYDRSWNPTAHTYSQAPNNGGFGAPQMGTNTFQHENMPPQVHPNQQMQFPMPHMFPQGAPQGFPQGYGNFPGPPPPPNFQGQWPPPPPPSMPGKPGWGRGGYNGMSRGRGGYHRGGRW